MTFNEPRARATRQRPVISNSHEAGAERAHVYSKEVRSEIELTESMLYLRLCCLVIANETLYQTMDATKQLSPTRTPYLQQLLSSLGTPNKTRARQRLSVFQQTIESAVGATVPRACLGYNRFVRRSQR